MIADPCHVDNAVNLDDIDYIGVKTLVDLHGGALGVVIGNFGGDGEYTCTVESGNRKTKRIIIEF